MHGWPLFEGNDFLRDQTFKNSDQLIPDISKNNIDLYYWDDGVANSAFEYLVNNSVEPTLFYYHSGDDLLVTEQQLLVVIFYNLKNMK